jgi:hypothetical protein
LAYLIIPVDLVPDFIPIIGYADDAIIVAIALRSVIRHAGPEAIHNHWPGTPGGLTAILRLTAPQNATDASRPSEIHGMSWHVTSCSAGVGEDGLRFGPVDSAGRSLCRQAQDRVAPAEDLRITPAPPELPAGWAGGLTELIHLLVTCGWFRTRSSRSALTSPSTTAAGVTPPDTGGSAPIRPYETVT